MSIARTFGLAGLIVVAGASAARAQVLSIDDRTVAEGAAVNAAFRVTLSAPLTVTVTVNYSTSSGTATAGSDYTSSSGTLTFTPGRTVHSLYVPIVSDTTLEPDEDFFVNLSGASGATISRAQAKGTITNPPADAQVAMFRTYSRNTDYHFFTTSLGSRSFTVGTLGFQDESVPPPFYVMSTQRPGSVPLFRMYNPNLGRHYYTADVASRDSLMTIGMVYEMVEGFLYPLGSTPPAGTTELFRLYNNNSGTHLFTADATQRSGILKLFPGVWVEHTSVGYVFTSGIGDLVQGAVDDTGPSPEPAVVSFPEGSASVDVKAYPGQVMVFFVSGVSEAAAQSLLSSQGATILAKIPAVGYYLVGTSPGTEGSLISSLTADSRVSSALPHVDGEPSAAAVTLIDDCSRSHGSDVKDALETDGGTMDECRNVAVARSLPGGGTQLVWPSGKVVRALLEEANQNGAGPTLINLSGAGGQYRDASGNLVDWSALPPGHPWIGQMQRGWRIFFSSVLGALAALPPEKRENLVVTVAAGNSEMDLTAMLAELRKNPRLAAVLKDNVLLVTHDFTKTFANYAPGDPDVASRNNAAAENGTSFAAPGAMAVIQNVMRLTGASPRIALKAAKQAVATNANHVLTQSEAIDKARIILGALKTDPIDALNVTGIAFTTVGATTGAAITPVFKGISVAYTVSGTDGYYDSGVKQTDTAGRVSFAIPPGAKGVRDTISVTAVASGITRTTQYTW